MNIDQNLHCRENVEKEGIMAVKTTRSDTVMDPPVEDSVISEQGNANTTMTNRPIRKDSVMDPLVPTSPASVVSEFDRREFLSGVVFSTPVWD